MNILKLFFKKIIVTFLFVMALIAGLSAMLLFLSFNVSAETASDFTEQGVPADNVEKHLILNRKNNQWLKESDNLTTEQEKDVNNTEIKKVLVQSAQTVKLENVVPPIQFKSGQADIPENYVNLLRDILIGLKDKVNVHLHFIGYTDNAKLTGALKEKYIDNMGLSRERAGTTAEYFQRALNQMA
jgi:flagellar motor protein MotB